MEGRPNTNSILPPYSPPGKRPGERPTPAQAEKHAELRSYGAVVVVAHSVDEALELLEVYL